MYAIIDPVWIGVLDSGHRLQDVGQKGKDVNNDENGLVGFSGSMEKLGLTNGVGISVGNGWVGPIFEKELPYPIGIIELVNTHWARSTRSTLKIYF